MGNTYDLKMDLDTLAERSHLYDMGPYDKMEGRSPSWMGLPIMPLPLSTENIALAKTIT